MTNQEMLAALKKYGQHGYHECIYKFVHDVNQYNKVTGEHYSDGSGHYVHRGPITECRCGLAQIINKLQQEIDTQATPVTMEENHAGNHANLVS